MLVRVKCVLACAAVLALGGCASAEEFILIAKAECRLFFASDGELIKEYPCANGRGMCTPVGTFYIWAKHPNAGWTYRNGQWVYVGGGMGPAFGALWMGLSTSWGRGSNYGIHGTNEPEKIGTLVSHGCIRMYNHHVDELYQMAPVGTTVRTVNYLDQGQDVLRAWVRYLLVYASNQDGDYDLYTVRSDGQGKQRALDLSGDQRMPVFSPDGEEIAFLDIREPQPMLCCLERSAKAVRELCALEAKRSLGWDEQGILVELTDGRIVAVDPQDGAVRDAEAPPEPRVTPDGEGLRWVDSGGQERGIGASAVRPKLTGPGRLECGRMSPDGHRIAFSCIVKGHRDVFACREDGKMLRNLTESAAEDVDPAWSPMPVFAPSAAVLAVKTDPPGLQILVRPPRSDRAYPKGRSPAHIAIASAGSTGAKFEVIAKDGASGQEARTTVTLALGQRAEVYLDLSPEDAEATFPSAVTAP